MSSVAVVLDETGSFSEAGYERRRLEAEVDMACDIDWMFAEMERADEAEMLRNVDRIELLTKVARFQDDEDVGDVIWDYQCYNWEEKPETVLIKSKPRFGRPTKRQLHPVNHRCHYLRNRREEVKDQIEHFGSKRRYAEANDLAEQLLPETQVLKSAHTALPKDMAIGVYGADRNFSVNFMPGGRIVYTFETDPLPPLFRRDVRFRASRHAYNYHPATSPSVRRPAR